MSRQMAEKLTLRQIYMRYERGNKAAAANKCVSTPPKLPLKTKA